jgi:hypothetical protein
VLLEATCAAEAPAPRAVEWLYDLALSHGLRALADGNTYAPFYPLFNFRNAE